MNPTPLSAPTGASSTLQLRRIQSPQDAQNLEQLTARTGFFSAEEIAIARELADSALSQGDSSGYLLALCEAVSPNAAPRIVGYTCFGPIPATLHSYDLYWIVVDPQEQRRGVGRILLQHSETLARSLGAGRMYIDTASREQYQPTHAFYTRCGYQLAARLEDFYSPGDSKLIFVKQLQA